MCPCPFQLPEASASLGLWPRPATASLWSLLLGFWLSCLPLWLKKDPCDCTGPSKIIQDKLSHLRILNLMTSAKSPSPCKISCSLVLGIRHGWGQEAAVLLCLPQSSGNLGMVHQSGEWVPARGHSHYQSLQAIFVVSAHSACYLFPLLHFPVNDSLLFHLSLSLE